MGGVGEGGGMDGVEEDLEGEGGGMVKEEERWEWRNGWSGGRCRKVWSGRMDGVEEGQRGGRFGVEKW